MELILSPYSSKVANGKVNAKNYPWFPKLVQLLNRDGYRVIQIGVSGEERIEGVGEFLANLSYGGLINLVNRYTGWISVDNFFPHFCHANKLKSGIVLWGPSDPRIWGYSRNINLLRGRDYLRQHQMQTWNEIEFDAQRFVYAENVIPHVHKLAPMPLTRRLALV